MIRERVSRELNDVKSRVIEYRRTMFRLRDRANAIIDKYRAEAKVQSKSRSGATEREDVR